MADRFLIAPYDQNSGQQSNVRPWLIPDQAFESLLNVYQFRGRVRKKYGARWFADDSLLSRFRVQVGTKAAPVPTPANIAKGQLFSIGSETYTVYQDGVNAALLASAPGTSGIATTGTTNYTLNSLQAGGTPIYWYPGLPAMGLLTYENNLTSNEFLVGFDTKFAYRYTTGWQRLDGEAPANVGASVWSGSNSQFFWGSTWMGTTASTQIFFVTNFNPPDLMRSFDGNTLQWSFFQPALTAGGLTLDSALIIVPFKNRLLVFNTWEGGFNYVNRCRYSQVGNVLPSSDPNAWRQDIAGKGNFIDAPTTEAIVTVEFVKDKLIVYFELSTFELVYTGNQAYPFAWQKINTELGAESTFSIIPFDKIALGVANVGIHACNGTVVERIDSLIPDEVFNIHIADSGVNRVYGIRDYEIETVYWTFPNTEQDTNFPYPDRVLVYNYKTGTWAFFVDSITCFGYYQPIVGITWDSTQVTWDSDVTWDSGSLQSLFRNTVAGNQEGFTFICDPDESANASLIQITNLTYAGFLVTVTAYNHNFKQGDYLFFEGITNTAGGNLTQINGFIFAVDTLVDNNTLTFDMSAPGFTAFSGTYTGAGRLARVDNINILTKEYNFYAKEGMNAYVSKVDFMVDATAKGETMVNFYVSTSTDTLVSDSQMLGSLVGTSVLDTFPYTAANNVPVPVPFEANATRLWHPVYFQADGEVIQLQLTMSPVQMLNPAIRVCGFQLHAMCFYAQPSATRFQ